MAERGASGKSRSAVAPTLRRAARHAAPGRFDSLRGVVADARFLPVLGVFALLVLVCAATLALGRGQLMVAEGRVLEQTWTARVELRVKDEAATERARQSAALMVPRVYTSDEAALRELINQLSSLPSVLAAAETLEQVAPEIRAGFALDADRFEAIRSASASESASAAWVRGVERLGVLLVENPLLSSEDLQLDRADPAERLDVRSGLSSAFVDPTDALAVGGDNGPVFRQLLLQAGFRGGALASLSHRLTGQARPLFTFEKGATDALRAEAASKIQDASIVYRPGEVLARRGEVLRGEQLELLRGENKQFRTQLSLVSRLLEAAGVLGLACVVASALTLYVRQFYVQAMRSIPKFFGIAALVALGALPAVVGSVEQPAWVWSWAVAPVMLSTMIGVVAYEPRLGFSIGAVQGTLVGAALGLPLGYFAAMMTGAAIAAWRMRDIRSRNDLVRASLLVAAGLAAATMVVTLFSRPMSAEGLQRISEALADSLRAGSAGFAAGTLALAMLPMVERLFDVTTGMTLSEWRDPRQPLLRKLQLQAPGTYNHSHTVAILAEAAAEAIGANGLHVYVGALYHDVGKMNKPDYFVENQPRGFNKHSKLSPAMSLLVIIGHVKDGVELAREYGLPRSLVEYIETHHGTTLVEYFFNEARRLAEDGDEVTPPEEVEYRYPGPRPRTKEEAILMLCDAVESATRAMAEPTAARLQALVHAMASKRLLDGQFDDCELRLRDLTRIEEAITRTLASIYHGRIAYPGAALESKDPRSPGTGSQGSAGGPSGGEIRSSLAEQAG